MNKIERERERDLMGECRINSPVTWEGSDPHSPAIVTTQKQDNTNNLKFKIKKKELQNRMLTIAPQTSSVCLAS